MRRYFSTDKTANRRLMIVVILVHLFFSMGIFAQNPIQNPADAIEIRFDRSQPVIRYSIEVDSSDLTGFNVEIRIRNVPDTFEMAMATHHEYDDRYWRFVQNFHVLKENGKSGKIIRLDSALWQIISPGGVSVIQYRIQLPPPTGFQRASHRPFLSSTGGLVGGIHSFMYIVGESLIPSYVRFILPRGWQIASGLEPTTDDHLYFAPAASILLDCPAMVGLLKVWRFTVDGVPHRIVYWPAANCFLPDSNNIVGGIQRFVEQAVALFGRVPYREYVFLFQDSAFGALEHLNSVTAGVTVNTLLSKNPTNLFGMIAHEFFHTWNLMRLRPYEYQDLNFGPQVQSAGLWWSEGMSMFYADLLLRRAGLPTADSTRIGHLATLIRSYLSNPGNAIISPEKSSLFSNSPPGMYGDYYPSIHVQGELIGVILDLLVREGSCGRHSMDDVMQRMFEKYSGKKGFHNSDIEMLITEMEGQNIRSFFQSYVSHGKELPLNEYLKIIGLKLEVSWSPVLDEHGNQSPDLRIFSWKPISESRLRLGITDPEGCWGKAGLHTGDIIVSIKGRPVSTSSEFRSILTELKHGDTVLVGIKRPSGDQLVSVMNNGYEMPIVSIQELKNPTAKQIRIRNEWKENKP